MSLIPQSKPPSAPAPIASTRILIVDDSVIDRRVAGGIVEKHPGLQPVYANDGNEALDMIAREAPAVVLTDLQMPELDGPAAPQQRFARSTCGSRSS